MNPSPKPTIQVVLPSENQSPQKPKSVCFSLEKNIVYPICKCSSEYLTKKQKKHLNRKISRSIRGRNYEDLTSSEEDYLVDQPCDDYGSCYSIIEWKKLQNTDDENVDANNQDSQDTNKSSSKKIKKSNLKRTAQRFQKELIQQDQTETEISSKKIYGIKQHIIVTEFDKILNDDDDEISITLDDLEEFNYQFKRGQEKQEISNFEQIKKKIDLGPKFDLIEFCDDI